MLTQIMDQFQLSCSVVCGRIELKLEVILPLSTMSYGGYGNRGYDYHQRRERINEDEVPESKHTIFIRGLPGDMSTDEIKEYFEDRIGPVSFDFVKTSADQQRLFVAVRFETRDDAKEAMSKYSENDLMGHRCELSWFKDIRRYAQYQNLNQSSTLDRFSNYSEPWLADLKDDILNVTTIKVDLGRGTEVVRLVTVDRLVQVGRHAPAGSPVSPNQEDSPTTPAAPVPANTEAEPVSSPAPLPPANPTPITVRFPLRSQNPANVISNTTFAIGIDSDELPRRVLRRMSPNAPMVTPPSVAAQEEEKMPQDMPSKDSQQNVVTTIGLPPPPCPPSFASEKKQTWQFIPLFASFEEPIYYASLTLVYCLFRYFECDGAPAKSHPSRFPTSARFFASLKEIQSSIIKTVKAEPKSDEASGGLRLSNLAMRQQDADEEKRAVRESRLSKLDEISLERFMVKKKRLEETFRGDCQTYAFVARKLIEKDPSLESQLRIALIENMEDLEKQVYEQVDAYLDTVCD
ncbi:unnamed protein product [Angiostrongylus costaricensis]|uniref:RRM domain-containing protein n=1 Tax=Angiostrongylus costaricensis TaxID=334426 RepID=A0A0R3PRG2_ANGCS|nr:unnamed protein product [Angiostrongylus costaricensis]